MDWHLGHLRRQPLVERGVIHRAQDLFVSEEPKR